MKHVISPIILCGGSGSRLWPLSRKSYPKQFSELLFKNSLFQQSVLRVQSSEVVSFSKPVFVTNSDFRFIVAHEIQDLGLNPDNIIIEPAVRNTAPAILAASLLACEKDMNTILLVTPSDHVMTDTLEFHKAISTGLAGIDEGRIVTFGIKPDRPETGYGYLQVMGAKENDVLQLERFIEKPNSVEAIKLFDSGDYYWNAGIFLFRASDMVAAFKKYAPDILRQVKLSIQLGRKDLDFFRLEDSAWHECEDISIDYAIMEKAKNISVVPYKGSWSDLGDWSAVWTEMGPDEKGVALSKNATAIDCQNVLLRSESDSQQLVGLGLENIIAIAMPDAVLIAHKDRSQDVKQVVEILKKDKLAQAEVFPKDHRPWGWFETLTISDRFQVKRILVHPGAALSLQSHHHRSEHWIVVGGTAKVTVSETVTLLTEGESIFIPLGAVHRMENPGKVPMFLIEVQTGVYLGEDDIVRYEDLYQRIQP